MPITNLEDQLVRDENEVLHAYQDSEGFWTIGVGHLIDVRRGGSIPQEISRALLRIDIASASEFVGQNFGWTQTIDEIRQGAFLNMAFNLRERLYGFKNFLVDMEQGKYAAAADEMVDSLWEKQVGARAHRLAEQIRTGTWQ